MLQTAIAALTSGGAYALLGVCIVMLYRLAGVLNFSQAAIGAFGTYVMLTAFSASLPYGTSVLLGVLAGTAVATVIGLMMAVWFGSETTIIRSTVTIAILLGILALGFRLFGDSPKVVPGLLPGVTVEFGGVRLTASGIAAVSGSLLLAFGLWLFLAKTRTGIILRALSDRSTTAELLGIAVRTLTVAVWAAAGAVSSVAVIVIAPTRTNDYLSLALLILPALAAALLGGFRSIGVTVAAGYVIALLEFLGARVPFVAQYRSVVPFLLILLALLWMQRSEVWDEAK